jgi:hypothetical protein
VGPHSHYLLVLYVGGLVPAAFLLLGGISAMRRGIGRARSSDAVQSTTLAACAAVMASAWVAALSGPYSFDPTFDLFHVGHLAMAMAVFAVPVALDERDSEVFAYGTT